MATIAAIAGAAIVIGGAAYGMAGSSKANKSTQGNIADFKDGLDAAMKNVPHVDPVQFDRLKLASLDKTFGEYLDQYKRLPDLERAANASNDAWQRSLERTAPGLKSSVKLASGLVRNRLLGNLSAETQANVARSGAYRALSGGFGADSAAGRALESRDLGRTTEDLQTQGFAMLPQLGQIASSMNPVSASQLMFNPAQIAQRRDQEAVFNTQVSNSEKAYNTSLDLENQNAKFQAMMNKVGLTYQANQASTNATAQKDQAISQGIMQIGGAVAGMGGAGGGGTGTQGVDWGKIGGMVFGGGGTSTAGAPAGGSGAQSWQQNAAGPAYAGHYASSGSTYGGGWVA